MANSLPLIALTAGEPGGIGPDLCIQLSQQVFPAKIVVFADQNMLIKRAATLRMPLIIENDFSERGPASKGMLYVQHHALIDYAVPGKLNPANSRYVLNTIDSAIRGCLQGDYAAMVTAPVHKGVINDAGFAFTGHTEYLAQQSHTEKVVMMLVGGGLRVALVTTHLALKEVPSALTKENLEATLAILSKSLLSDFGIRQPRIAVTGLNPHAGESGHLGNEEIEVIIPALEKIQANGINVAGPFPADTIFVPQRLKEFDCVLAMYHDQGLAVLKYASFGTGVNVTLGLPFVRTSVDHGTALDLAGSGEADCGSLISAIHLAIELANRRSDATYRT